VIPASGPGDRFSPAVAAALRAAGWFPGRQVDPQTMDGVHRELHQQTGRFGGRLPDPPAEATRALNEFGGLVIGAEGPGRDLNPRPFALDPTLAGHSLEALIDTGRALGTGLYPIGAEGLDDSVLAINLLGQVVAIDAVGEWFLGDTIEAALETLITGRRPARIADDGRWPGRIWDTTPGDPGDQRPIGRQKRPVGAAFYLPRTPFNLYDVWLPETLTRIGTVPVADVADPGTLTVEWAGLDCEAHVLDLDQHTVLVLAFELTRFVDQLLEAERTGTDSTEIPLALAFRQACVALTDDLDVAFAQTRQTHHLLEFITEHEYEVLIADATGLYAEGLPLLYLSEAYASGISGLLEEKLRDEMPAVGGRLIFGGTGEARW
jgi:SUKH-3 immunity protein